MYIYTMIYRIICLMSVVVFSFCTSGSINDLKIVATGKPSSPDTLVISSDKSEIDTVSLNINFSPSGDYLSVKNKSAALKKQLMTLPDSVRKEKFEAYLLNEIIPFWYKTPWDFNGYTDVPGKGVIACGYFVSTVLKHAGLNINRYTLAQQNPKNEAKTIAGNDSTYFYACNAEKLQEIFKKQHSEGLYFAGLDFHVGFLLFRKDELYFIHSNYIGSEGVVFEKAVFSEAFNASQNYFISAVSANPEFIQKWMNSVSIEVIREKK
jgi:hypothetical protein